MPLEADEETSQTVRSVHTVQTYDHTVHTETVHCVDTLLCLYSTTQFYFPNDALIKGFVDILIFVKKKKRKKCLIESCESWNTSAEGTCNC